MHNKKYIFIEGEVHNVNFPTHWSMHGDAGGDYLFGDGANYLSTLTKLEATLITNFSNSKHIRCSPFIFDVIVGVNGKLTSATQLAERVVIPGDVSYTEMSLPSTAFDWGASKNPWDDFYPPDPKFVNSAERGLYYRSVPFWFKLLPQRRYLQKFKTKLKDDWLDLGRKCKEAVEDLKNCFKDICLDIRCVYEDLFHPKFEVHCTPLQLTPYNYFYQRKQDLMLRAVTDLENSLFGGSGNPLTIERLDATINFHADKLAPNGLPSPLSKFFPRLT
jgi:hypothetical protein